MSAVNLNSPKSTCCSQTCDNFKDNRYTVISSGSISIAATIYAVGGTCVAWVVTASVIAVTALAYFLFLLLMPRDAPEQEGNPVVSAPSISTTATTELLSRTPSMQTPVRSRAVSVTSDPCPMHLHDLPRSSSSPATLAASPATLTSLSATSSALPASLAPTVSVLTESHEEMEMGHQSATTVSIYTASGTSESVRVTETVEVFESPAPVVATLPRQVLMRSHATFGASRATHVPIATNARGLDESSSESGNVTEVDFESESESESENEEQPSPISLLRDTLQERRTSLYPEESPPAPLVGQLAEIITQQSDSSGSGLRVVHEPTAAVSRSAIPDAASSDEADPQELPLAFIMPINEEGKKVAAEQLGSNRSELRINLEPTAVALRSATPDASSSDESDTEELPPAAIIQPRTKIAPELVAPATPSFYQRLAGNVQRLPGLMSSAITTPISPNMAIVFAAAAYTALNQMQEQ